MPDENWTLVRHVCPVKKKYLFAVPYCIPREVSVQATEVYTSKDTIKMSVVYLIV